MDSKAENETVTKLFNAAEKMQKELGYSELEYGKAIQMIKALDDKYAAGQVWHLGVTADSTKDNVLPLVVSAFYEARLYRDMYFRLASVERVKHLEREISRWCLDRSMSNEGDYTIPQYNIHLGCDARQGWVGCCHDDMTIMLTTIEHVPSQKELEGKVYCITETANYVEKVKDAEELRKGKRKAEETDSASPLSLKKPELLDMNAEFAKSNERIQSYLVKHGLGYNGKAAKTLETEETKNSKRARTSDDTDADVMSSKTSASLLGKVCCK